MPSRTPAFEEGLARLARAGDAPAAVAERFAAALRGLEDWGLARINPLRFAREQVLEERHAVDLFVRGAKVGLFDLEWSTICPLCGSMEHSTGALHGVASERFHCATCDVDVDADLDDAVGVWFSLSPGCGRLAIDPFADFASFRRYFFSPELQRTPEQQAVLARAPQGWVRLPPHSGAALEFEAAPATRYRLVNLACHAAAYLEADGGPAREQEVAVRFDLEGPEPRERTIAPGRVRLRLENATDRPGSTTVLRVDPCIADLFRRQMPTMGPLLTAKRLLNHQLFRDLFRVQSLAPELKLRMRSVTLLFTDLKGSTALYDSAGDVQAYRVVREHFALLAGAIRENGGAVIKTMGDAVMASFSTPLDGARAAVAMTEAVEERNAGAGFAGTRLGLKVGLHSGPALVVNADERLDYFGQTVNVAARVQALSAAGEIHLTEALEQGTGVRELLHGRGFAADRRSVELKGVGQPLQVARYRRSASA